MNHGSQTKSVLQHLSIWRAHDDQNPPLFPVQGDVVMYKNNLNKQVGKLGLIINMLLSGELKRQQRCTLYSPVFLWYTGTRGFHWQLMQRIGGKILLSSTVKNMIVLTAWYHSCSLHYGKVKSWIINFIKTFKVWRLIFVIL